METTVTAGSRGRGFALATAFVLCAAFYLLQIPGQASGQSRTQRQEPQPHFRSGAQLSVDVLQEISATLKQIDTRLANLEQIAAQLHPPMHQGPGAVPGSARPGSGSGRR